MTSETKTDEYVVGQKMILVREHHEPMMVNIDRLTKTQILIRHPEALNNLKMSYRFERAEYFRETSGTSVLVKHDLAGGRSNRRYRKELLYDYSDEVMVELQMLQSKINQRLEEKKQAEAIRLQEIASNKAKEMAEVKSVCAGRLMMKVTMRKPDGTRIYVLDVPMNAEYTERKKGWETVMVVCKDTEELDWEKWGEWKKEHKDKEITDETTKLGEQACSVRRVEFSFTWINGSHSSFSSCSTNKLANDTEALWEVMRYVYTSW